MTRRALAYGVSVLLATLAFSSAGCVGLSQGISLGPLAIPIPVSPYFQDKKEDEFWDHERYDRVPILGPLTAGGPAVALRSAQRRRGHGGVGASTGRRGRPPVAVRSAAQQRADREGEDRRLRRSAAVLSR